ncbi:MAG TPA: glycosyltransferase [Candidatus Paceibacterota bacterium]|nr:glycosyltransferase [Candidatus Paceibacterota bacterium]
METPKKKVLFLIPTLAAGGAERVVSELSKHAPDHIELVLVVFEKKVSYEFRGRVESLAVPVTSPILPRFPRFFLRWWRLRKLLTKEKPDSVVSFGYSADLLNILCNRKAVIRVDMFLSAGRRGVFGSFTKLIAKVLFRRAALILAVAHAIKEDLIQAFGVPEQRIRVIPNPIDMQRIQQLAREPLPVEYQHIFGKPVVVTMGRLTRQKGQWHLLKAFGYIKSKAPEAQLVVLGEGVLKDQLRALAADLGIEKQVHFLGWQENPYRFLGKARVFALSSLWEGLPMVLLEAMACGLPVVSTDCKSGPKEILDPDIGILTPVCARDWGTMGKEISREEQLLGQALLRVLGDKEYAALLAQKSLSRAQDFDNSRVLGQYDFLWKEMFYEKRL